MHGMGNKKIGTSTLGTGTNGGTNGGTGTGGSTLRGFSTCDKVGDPCTTALGTPGTYQESERGGCTCKGGSDSSRKY